MPEITESQTQQSTEQLAEQQLSTERQVGPLEHSDAKWGDGAPALLKGKSIAETLDIVGKLTMALQQYAAAPKTQEVVKMPEVVKQIDDNLLVTDPAEWRRQFAEGVNLQLGQTLAQAAAPIYSNIAATAETLAKADPVNKEVAEKWWAEVREMVTPIPEHMRSQALYTQAAKMARANHIDEIASAKAAAIAGAGTGLEGGGTRGADGAPPVEGNAAAWDKISKSAIGKKMLDQYGKAKVVATAKQMNMTLDKYADMVAGSRTAVDPEKPGTWYTDLHVKEVVNG